MQISPVSARILDAVAEIGELAAELRSIAESSRTDQSVLTRCADELGDALFCVVALQWKLRSASHTVNHGKARAVQPVEPSACPPQQALEVIARMSHAMSVMSKAYLLATAYGTCELCPADETLGAAVGQLLTLISQVCFDLGAGEPDDLVEKAVEKYRSRLGLCGSMGSQDSGTRAPDLQGGLLPHDAIPCVKRTHAPSLGQDTAELKEFAIDLAFKGGEIIRRYFRSQHGLEYKADGSPVTPADREAEALLRKLIRNRYPQHGIIGEEFGAEPSTSGSPYTWIIDPLDGTKSFISGSFDFGTLIAVTNEGVPIIGLVYQPILEDLVIGDNIATAVNGRKAHFRRCDRLSAATLLTTDWMAVERFQEPRGFRELTKRVKMCRTWGNCFGYTLLCGGFADIMIDPIMSVWDSTALIPIIRGAGGVITDYKGNDPVTSTSIVAAACEIHEDVISILDWQNSQRE